MKITRSVILFTGLIITSCYALADPIIVQTNLGAGRTQLVVTGTDSEREQFLKPFNCTGGGVGTYKVAGSLTKVAIGPHFADMLVVTDLNEDQLVRQAAATCDTPTNALASCTTTSTLPALATGPGNGIGGCSGHIEGVGTILTMTCSCIKK